MENCLPDIASCRTVVVDENRPIMPLRGRWSSKYRPCQPPPLGSSGEPTPPGSGSVLPTIAMNLFIDSRLLQAAPGPAVPLKSSRLSSFAVRFPLEDPEDLCRLDVGWVISEIPVRCR